MADYKSQQINRGSISDILQLLQGYSSGHERAKDNIAASQNNLSKLIGTAQTPEQIENAQQALRNIAGDSSQYVESSLGYQALSNVLENKTTAINLYKDTTNQAVEYIEGADFWDSSEEFMNLNAKANEMVIDDDGNKIAKYESSYQMISEKYNEVNSMIANIEAGQNSKLRLGKIKSKTINGKTWNDQDVLSTLNDQKDRLDAAMLASVNNGEITAPEAALIMGGMNRDEFKSEKGNIVSEIYHDINSNTRASDSIGKIDKKILEGALKEEDIEVLKGFNFGNVKDKESNFSLLELAEGKGGDLGREKAAAKLLEMKEEFDSNVTSAKTRHYQWTGRGYAAQTGLGADIETVDENLKADFIDSDKYDTIVKKGEEEAAILEGLDKDIEDASNEDLMNRYGTTDPDKIKTILQKGYDEEQEKIETKILEDADKAMEESSNEDLMNRYGTTDRVEIRGIIEEEIEEQKRQAIRKRFAKEAEEFKVLDPSTIKRETPKEFVISKLEKDPSMEIPEDAPEVSFKDVMGSNIENKEVKAIKHYKLDGFKSSIGKVLNRDGSRLNADELLSKYDRDISKLREKLISVKQDRKLKGAPTREQNELIKAITRYAGLIKKYSSPKHMDETDPKIIAEVKRRMEEAYNKLMDDFMGNLNQKTISKIKDKYTK